MFNSRNQKYPLWGRRPGDRKEEKQWRTRLEFTIFCNWPLVFAKMGKGVGWCISDCLCKTPILYVWPTNPLLSFHFFIQWELSIFSPSFPHTFTYDMRSKGVIIQRARPSDYVSTHILEQPVVTVNNRH